MKLINRHRQLGLSGPSWLIIIAIFSLLITMFFKVFPMYYQSYQIKTILTSVQEDASIDAKSKAAIWEGIRKRLDVNSIITISRQNVKMSRKDGKTTIVISYESRDSFIGNLFIGGNFNESVVIDR